MTGTGSDLTKMRLSPGSYLILDLMESIPVFVARRKNQKLRIIVDSLVIDCKGGLISRKAAAEIFAFHGLPLCRALELLAGRKAR